MNNKEFNNEKIVINQFKYFFNGKPNDPGEYDNWNSIDIKGNMFSELRGLSESKPVLRKGDKPSLLYRLRYGLPKKLKFNYYFDDNYKLIRADKMELKKYEFFGKDGIIEQESSVTRNYCISYNGKILSDTRYYETKAEADKFYMNKIHEKYLLLKKAFKDDFNWGLISDD